MKKKMLILLSLLGAISIGSCAHLPDPPQYDICVVLVGGDARCFPQQQPGKPEYILRQDQLMGGWWMHPSDYAKLEAYVEELEERLKDLRGKRN
jgi:hypothetical protein